MSDGRRDAVDSDRRGNLFCLYGISKKDERKLEEGIALHFLRASIFVDNVPSWRYLHDDIARAFGIESVANAADAWCPSTLCDAMGRENVPDAAELEKEIFTMLEYLCKLELLLLEQLVVDVKLVAKVAFYILPIAKHGA